MKVKISIIIVVITLLVASCSIFNTGNDDRMKQNSKDIKIILEPTIIRGFSQSEKDLSLSIKQASLTDTLLTVEVVYLGGCRDHKFELVFNGMYKKSLPRKADLFLVHENNGDTCKKELKMKLQYNLSSIIGSQKQAIDFTLVGFTEKLRYGNVSR